MRILVIGGTAFMGPFTIRRLVGDGHEVTVFHRGETERDLAEGIAHIHGDRSEIGRFRAQIGEFEPEVVLHTIAMTDGDARAALDAVRGIARRLVVLSSVDVYRAYDVLRERDTGPLQPVPLVETSELRRDLYPYREAEPRPEDDPRRWLDQYDKILVERAVMEDPDVTGTVLRLPMVYGPGDRQHRLRPYVRRMLDGRPVIPLAEGFAGWRSCFGYVENMADAIALAVVDRRAENGIYNVSDATSWSSREMVEEIGRAMEWRGEVRVLPAETLPPEIRPEGRWKQDLTVDTSRVRGELNVEERVPVDERLRRTIAWETQHPVDEVEIAREYEAEDAALLST